MTTLVVDINHAKTPSEVKATSIPNPAATLCLDGRSCLSTMTPRASEATLKTTPNPQRTKSGKDSTPKTNAHVGVAQLTPIDGI